MHKQQLQIKTVVSSACHIAYTLKLISVHVHLKYYWFIIATYFKDSDESKEQQLQDPVSNQPINYHSEQAAAAPNEDHCEYYHCIHVK